VIADRNIDERHPDSVVNKYSSAWVKRKTCPGMEKRVPIFVCLLRQVDLTAMDPGCVLADRAGCVSATVHREVIERYGTFFHPGAALVLKNVHVVMTARNHYMLITLNNLVTLYRPKDGASSVDCRDICKLTSDDIDSATKAAEEEERRLKISAAASARGAIHQYLRIILISDS
jgi:hypothetical protein